MIKLTQKELFTIIADSIKKDYKVNATDIKVCVKWEHMSHDRSNQIYYFDATKDWISFISYYDGYSHKELTVADIKMYLEGYYPEYQFASLSYRIKDDAKFLRTETEEEWKALATLSMEVYYDDEAELNKEDVREMIELALKLNDKAWFQELVDKYRNMNEEERNRKNA